MFESHLPPDVIEGPVKLAANLDYNELANATEGYALSIRMAHPSTVCPFFLLVFCMALHPHDYAIHAGLTLP